MARPRTSGRLPSLPDGYLWLGTGAGLYRFDGVRFEQIRPQGGTAFPAIDITALLAPQIR